MERQLQINWPIFVEEAKQRRKEQKLTQAKLAILAGISTPTVSRFESGKDDIQLSSVMKILEVLGMLDKRDLKFDDAKANLDFDKNVIEFFGSDHQKKKIRCAVSVEAVEDNFGGNDVKHAYLNNQGRIEQLARRKYLTDSLEPDGSILITTKDIMN